MTCLSPYRSTPDMSMPTNLAAISELLDVMSELKDVLVTENDLLERGLPAGLSEVADRKVQLSEEYAELSQEVLVRHAAELVADPDLNKRLLATGQELRALTAENMQRLDDALAATRRRIDSVMSAIRQFDETDPPAQDSQSAESPDRARDGLSPLFKV
jgi:flagellar biosynthesis/type III secretory pathway chaperone